MSPAPITWVRFPRPSIRDRSVEEPWFYAHRGTDDFPGAQIDSLIDRRDKAINLCEIKCNHEPFLITKKYADQLRMKKASFLHFTKSHKSIFYTFITSGGLVENDKTTMSSPFFLVTKSGALVSSTKSIKDLRFRLKFDYVVISIISPVTSLEGATSNA